MVRVDAPGHGGSAATRADLVAGADLIADACGPATYLGYSMGARFALHVAHTRPEAARGLVLVSGTAGIDDPADRAARRHADDALAGRLESIGVNRFIDEWLAQPMFAGLDEATACRHERRANTSAGLASSLRLAGTGTQEPLWSLLAQVTAPVLVVTGADDTKFTALGDRLARAVGGPAEHAVIDGAGHTAHLERPMAFLDVTRRWLAAHDL